MWFGHGTRGRPGILSDAGSAAPTRSTSATGCSRRARRAVEGHQPGPPMAGQEWRRVFVVAVAPHREDERVGAPPDQLPRYHQVTDADRDPLQAAVGHQASIVEANRDETIPRHVAGERDPPRHHRTDLLSGLHAKLQAPVARTPRTCRGPERVDDGRIDGGEQTGHGERSGDKHDGSFMDFQTAGRRGAERG